MERIRCIVVDDEPLARLGMAKLIAEEPVLDLIASFSSAVEVMDWLKDNPIDLIFLDIEMPDLSGVALVKKLPEEVKVVFTTAYSEYAALSYDLDAVDYLLKPISRERLKQTIEKLRRYFPSPSETTPTLMIRAGRKNQLIAIPDIVYIEGLKDYVKIFCTDNRYTTRLTIKNALSSLPASRFLRIHKSFIINRDYLVAFDGMSVELSTGPNSQPITLPVGLAFRDALKSLQP